MQIILASAKIMRETCPVAGIMAREPRFRKEAMALAADMGRKTGAELSELFGCSLAIGEQNRQRFAAFGSEEAEVIPAVLAYNGQAYRHLKADNLSPEDLV